MALGKNKPEKERKCAYMCVQVCCIYICVDERPLPPSVDLLLGTLALGDFLALEIKACRAAIVREGQQVTEIQGPVKRCQS